ncbi:MAG: glycosyltransferase [Bacteroidales bacterium]|nr:glycosyltransferase [Bacteroidales bacterium]
MASNPLISILIPVFNAGKTLPRTLQCLSALKGKDAEVLFVNDGSTDETCAILEAYIGSNPEVECHLFHQTNQGVAAARNTAIENAKGQWLLFLDADDLYSNSAFDIISTELIDSIDVLGWDWVNENGTRTRSMRQADYSTPTQALINMMGGTMKWNLWLFAIRRKLIIANNIRFIPGADMGEDMGFILKVFACSKTVRQIHLPLYRYNASNPSSISVKMDEKRRKEVTANLKSAESFLLQSDFADLFRAYLPHLQLFIKLPLLIGPSQENYRIWYSWFSEANGFAFKNPDLPFRTRLLQWIASKQLWPAVRCYNRVYKTLYRFIENRSQ